MFVILFANVCFAGGKAPVEYVRQLQPLEMVSPLDRSLIAQSVLGLLGSTNGTPLEDEIIGWAVKVAHMDQPPIVYEEVILLEHLATNKWVIAYVARTACRGYTGMDVWREGMTAPGCNWYWFRSEKPNDNDLIKFFKQSNFGNNEFDPNIKPIHVAIYSPHKKLLQTAVSSLSKEERQIRYQNRFGLISDPADAFKRKKP